MKLSAKVAAGALLLGVFGAGAAFAGEAMCACCKDMAEKMACCDDKKAESSNQPTTPQHQH